MSLTLLNPVKFSMFTLKGYTMPKKVHTEGKKFGRLLVKSQYGPISNCICDCGNIINIPNYYLTSGDTKSCGCLRKDLLRIDLINKRFGKLLVLKQIEKRGNSSSQFWLCRCDCGNEHNVSSQHLRENQVKSCGCWFDKSEEQLLEEAKARFYENIEKTESCWIWKGNS